jgi:hypothetical protein
MGAVVLVTVAVTLTMAPAASGDAHCRHHSRESVTWAKPRRMTVLVDSVLLSGKDKLHPVMPCWRKSLRGRPALMVRFAERELRTGARRVAPLVVIGLGYNSLWERGRRNFSTWAARFDREALRLLATLRRRGARQFIWVTLREPTARTVPPYARSELSLYSWYFPWVNERLHQLDERRDDLVLADWAAVSRRPGLTYDTIHLNERGALLMARTIKRARDAALRAAT